MSQADRSEQDTFQIASFSSNLISKILSLSFLKFSMCDALLRTDYCLRFTA